MFKKRWNQHAMSTKCIMNHHTDDESESDISDIVESEDVCVHFLKLLDTQTQKWTQSLTFVNFVGIINNG